MLFGITLSTLIRNTAISTVICTICYVVIPFEMKMLETFISLDFLRFLPFRNFDFISQVLRVNTYFMESVVISLILKVLIDLSNSSFSLS